MFSTHMEWMTGGDRYSARSSAELHGGVGGVWRGSSLGPSAHPAWPPGSADPTRLRKTVCEAAKERRDRCRSHMRSSATAEHAVRCCEERTATGGGFGISDS